MSINIQAMIEEAYQRQAEREEDKVRSLAEYFLLVFGYAGGSWLGISWKLDPDFRPVGELELPDHQSKAQLRQTLDGTFYWSIGALTHRFRVEENPSEEQQAFNRDQLLITLGQLIEQVDRKDKGARLRNNS